MRISLMILMSLIYCQSNGQQDLKVYLEDYNNDGVLDTLKTYYDGGSSFGGKFVELVNGKTEEVHEITNSHSSGEIRYTIVLPPELDKIENELFLKAVKKELLPERRDIPEGSLNWIIKAIQSNMELDDNSFFDLIIDPETKWDKSELKLPTDYYLDIEREMMLKLGNISNDFYQYDIGKGSKGFLIYNAHNHYRNESGDSLKLSDSNSVYKAFHTSHGVVVKKGSLHKWAFINDSPLTRSPDKLRWESIKSVLVFDHYLVVHHLADRPDTDQFFIINIETGICGRIKSNLYNPMGNYIDRMKTPQLRAGEIIFDSEGGQFTYNLRDIFNELESQYIVK